MITTSSAWKEYAKESSLFQIKAVLTPQNGTALNLTGEDFMAGTVKITDATSDFNTFTTGAVVTNTFSCVLNNVSGKFDDVNFTGATISVQLGIIFEDETEEWINKGVYTVDKPSSLGSTIQLTCYDYMDKLNTYYIGKRWKFYTPGDYSTAELIDIAFPQTAETMMQYLCDYCHVSWDASSWNLGAFTVNEFEYDESTTCRQVLGWILQCCGGFAKMSPLGVIRCTWYNAKVWASETDLDGGLISDNGVWGASDTADGGTMWVAVASYDGGEMLSGSSIELNKVASTTVGVDDIRITGVRAYANGTVDEFEFETVGESGYVLALQDNPLITSDNMLAVATLVYNQVKDLQFRIFNLSAWASPDIEAGDSCLIQDYRGKVYPSIITNVTYNLNGLSDMSCGAETPGENSLEIANPQTQTIAGATRAAYDYITTRKITANTIKGGTLTLGGLSNINGSISILDADGNQIGIWDKDGIVLNSANLGYRYIVPSDYIVIKQIIMAGTQLDPTNIAQYDLNGDDKVSALDYTYAKNHMGEAIGNARAVDVKISQEAPTSATDTVIEVDSGENMKFSVNGQGDVKARVLEGRVVIGKMFAYGDQDDYENLDDGVTKDIVIKDANNVTRTLTFKGGILTNVSGA